MTVKIIMNTARSAVAELEPESLYYTKRKYRILVNGQDYGETDRTITGIYGLKPDTEYIVAFQACDGSGVEGSVEFHTDPEFVTLNVRDFGAKGDGVTDDTAFIQAAILACPPHSRVLVPEGTYRITPLFLKDHLRMELAKGAVLSADTDRTKFPILKGMISSYDEQSEYNLGTWEGNPLSMYAGIITGIGVTDAVLYGQGMIDGNASMDNWWKDIKTIKDVFRSRIIFLNHCTDVTIEGIQVQNSPSWTIHPYFSSHIRFLGMSVKNPKVSPNTDGLDPESCHDVEITGVHFSVGDDCIAVKSGKIYMGATYKTPCSQVRIHHCCMRDGHGSVTLGSEMAGGIRDLMVSNCEFHNTDRGLRIKTRRGRGKDAVIDGICFENIYMDQVMTPFVANCFYFCDPDGHSEYVQSKEYTPADERTPRIKSLRFYNITAENCHVAGGFFYGLPEQKIDRIEMDHVRIAYAEDARADVPAMMEGISPGTRQGIYANNVKELILTQVEVVGQQGEAVTAEHVDRLVRR